MFLRTLHASKPCTHSSVCTMFVNRKTTQCEESVCHQFIKKCITLLHLWFFSLCIKRKTLPILNRNDFVIFFKFCLYHYQHCQSELMAGFYWRKSKTVWESFAIPLLILTPFVISSDVPKPPQDLAVTDVLAESCKLVWKEPEFDGGCPITGKSSW